MPATSAEFAAVMEDVLEGDAEPDDARYPAEGEQSLQALLPFVRESAGKLEVHEAEQGILSVGSPWGWRR
jgi:hypothetical protein